MKRRCRLNRRLSDRLVRAFANSCIDLGDRFGLLPHAASSVHGHAPTRQVKRTKLVASGHNRVGATMLDWNRR